MKNTFLLTFALSLLCFSLSAQSTWYTVGQHYTFKSASVSNPGNTITLDVVYDANSNATVTKSTATSIDGDKYQTFTFGNQSEITQNGTDLNFTTTDGVSYYLISFDNGNIGTMPDKGDIVLHCDCSWAQIGGCEVHGLIVDGLGCYGCINNNCSGSCGLKQHVIVAGSSGPAINGGILLLKANTINL